MILVLFLVELVWDRKYDKSGVKAAPLKLALPFQTIETLNESSQQRQKSIDSFLIGRAETEWRNRLIWGDKKYVLPSLLPEFSGKVNLVYIDPPFATGDDFSFSATIPDYDGGEERISKFDKEPSIIEQKAYRDIWTQGLDSYLQWFYETAVLLHELLSETGSIYVHLDSHIGHNVKVIMDEVFGREHFLNEIVWKRFNFHADAKRFGRVSDRILFYSKTDDYTFETQRAPYKETYINSKFTHVDKDGRRFRLDNLNPPANRGPVYEFHGITRAWRFTKEKMLKLEEEGRIYAESKIPQLKRYLDVLEEGGGAAVHEIWDDISAINSQAKERLGYSTQKPEALLERIIKTSSNEGDLVLDCFCGSGTTASVAEKLGRRWIVCDLGRYAVHTTRKRLLDVNQVKPFVIQNLGKYERQIWQTAEFGDEAKARVMSYNSFILKLYNAQPLNGYLWLQGKKGTRLVHVGSVDSPISPLDVGQIVAEFKRSIGKGKEGPRTYGIDVLGWDFAFELNEIAKQQAAQANVDVRFLRIPREVLDKRAVEEGDVRFFELASLDVTVKIAGKRVTININDFVIPVDDVPSDVQKEIKHWSQWIDYWAVDWNNKNDTFHNEWQEYRTQEKPKLRTEASKAYDESGEYRIVVKVIDILGNDTTKLLRVKV
jgi:adenine specific DNA methylase Mod